MLRAEYGRRMEIFCQRLRENLPPGYSFEQPRGGYFIWIKGQSDDFGAERLEHLGVKVLEGQKASSAKNDRWKNSFRLSIAYYDVETLARAAIVLGKSLKKNP